MQQWSTLIQFRDLTSLTTRLFDLRLSTFWSQLNGHAKLQLLELTNPKHEHMRPILSREFNDLYIKSSLMSNTFLPVLRKLLLQKLLSRRNGINWPALNPEFFLRIYLNLKVYNNNQFCLENTYRAIPRNCL